MTMKMLSLDTPFFVAFNERISTGGDRSVLGEARAGGAQNFDGQAEVKSVRRKSYDPEIHSP
jgi:hypothetical protein